MSKEIRSECPEKVHYAHDFALVNEILECLKWKSEAQKRALDSKGLIVNDKKTKIMISIENAGMVTEERKCPFILFPERLLIVISSSASFAGLGCI